MSRLLVSCILLLSTRILQVTAQVDYCANAPCKSGGTCTSLSTGFHCQCMPGFAGTDCNDPINECLSNPCLNGGLCGDLTNGYKCDCKSGSYGLRCEQQGSNTACSSNFQCPTDRMCVQETVGYRCDCLPGTQGTPGNPCTDINECLSNPCGQYGTCWNGNNGYVCHCQDGSTGPTCTVGPCGGCARGQCNAATGYKCVCQPAVTGPQCHDVIPSDASGIRGGLNIQMTYKEFYSPGGQQLKLELEMKLKEKLLYVPHGGVTVTGFGLANGGKPGLEAYFYVKSQKKLDRQGLSMLANDIARALNGGPLYLMGANRLIQDPMAVFVTDVDETNIIVHLTGNAVCTVYTHARWCLNGGSCVSEGTRPTCWCPDNVKGPFCADGTIRKIIIIVCSVLGAVILIAILLCCCCCLYRRRSEGPRYVHNNYVTKCPAPPVPQPLPCTCQNTHTKCTCIQPVVVNPPTVGGHVPSMPTPTYTAFVNQTTPIITEIKSLPEPSCSCSSTISHSH